MGMRSSGRLSRPGKEELPAMVFEFG